MPNLEGDPKYSKRGPNFEQKGDLKGTERGPKEDQKGDPLVVAGLLWEGGLEDQFVRLVVQVVVQVVPQQAVDQNCLALKVVSQGCSSQASVKSGSARGH